MGRAVILQFHIPSLTVRGQCRTSVREIIVWSYGSGHQSHAPLIKKPLKKDYETWSHALPEYVADRLHHFKAEPIQS